MNKVKLSKLFPLVLLAMLAPVFAYAQTQPSTGSTGASTGAATTIGVPSGFSGIFSCNQNGAYAMSVGALGASGGVYVPVADATVELNTGTLVYKECVLREVVDAEREAATAGFVQQGTNQILTGRNGSPYFAQYQSQEMTNVGTNAVIAYLKNGTSSLDPNIQAQVNQAIAQGYSISTYNAGSMLTCPYPGVTNANAQFSWNTILAVASPCNPLFGYIDANDQAMAYAAAEQNCLQNEWQWGGGFYAVTSGNGGPCEEQVVTPSSEVNGLYTQLAQSPFNQLQSANDLGQMVGALFAGISTQVLSGTGGGLAGLTQPIGTGPSYLQQAVNQETSNLQSTVANAALANLDPALQIEQQYFNIMSQIAGELEGAISQLRGDETTCFQQVAQALCPSGIASNGTCTDVNGVQLKISTSTEFSQPLLSAPLSGGESIDALATTTANNLQVSQQALALINQLIQNVSGSSADSQAVAIEQLNSLIANKQLHTEADIQTAQTQQQTVQGALSTLTTNTPQLWAGTDPNNTTNDNIPWNGSIGATQLVSDPGVGWCNFKNQATLSAWESIWKQS